MLSAAHVIGEFISIFMQEHVYESSIQPAETSSRLSKKIFWSHHIETWERFGQAQVHYRQENQLNKRPFTYWKSKLDKASSLSSLLPVTVQEDEQQKVSFFHSGIRLPFDDRMTINELTSCYQCAASSGQPPHQTINGFVASENKNEESIIWTSYLEKHLSSHQIKTYGIPSISIVKEGQTNVNWLTDFAL